MINIKGYKHIANKQIIVNSQRNISIVLGIMLNIILFTIVGNMCTYSRERGILEAKSITGNYEAILKGISRDEIDILKNNVLTNTVGVYKEIYNEVITLGEIKKNIEIYAMDNISLRQNFSPLITLTNGRLPQSENEIIIDNLGKYILNKNIGDDISLNNINYKVVGIYNKWESSNLYDVQLITFLNNTNAEDLNAVFDVKNKIKKDVVIIEIAQNFGVKYGDNNSDKELIFNNLLFYNYGINVINNNSIIRYAKRQEIILYLVILILTSLFIYGVINASVNKRIKQFSILRCMGATPSKIRRILIKESFLLLIYSLVPSIIIGEILSFFISEIVLSKIMNINNYGLSFKIYIPVLLMVILLSIISIALAIINPIIKVGRIDPIEGINIYRRTEIGVKKIESKLIKKIFGYNAELAYKNIRANRKSFFITTIASILLLTTFIVFQGYHKNILDAYEKQKKIINDVTLDISFKGREGNESIFSYADKYINEITELNIAKNIFTIVNYNLDGIFENMSLNKWINEINSQYTYGEKSINIDGKESIFSNDINLVILDDLALNKVLSLYDNDLSIKDFKENGALITNRIVLKNYINPEREEIFNLKKGEEFNLLYKNASSISDEYDIEKEIEEIKELNKELKFKYLGSIDGKIIFDGGRYGFQDSPTLIVSSDFYKNNEQFFRLEKEEGRSEYIGLIIDFNNNLDRNTQVEVLKHYSNKIEAFFLDNKQSNKSFEESSITISAITYTVLFLTVLVGVVNIINNKNINIKNRYQEIGTILAIGISKKRLKRILLLEGLIQWFIASIVSIISSYVTLKIIFEILFYSSSIESGKMPISAMITGGLFLLGVNILASYLPIKKLENKNTIDLIRSNE